MSSVHPSLSASDTVLGSALNAYGLDKFVSKVTIKLCMGLDSVITVQKAFIKRLDPNKADQHFGNSHTNGLDS